MNLIFDLGNILIEWNKDKILSKIIPEDDYDLFDKVIFQSGLWDKLDKGELTIIELQHHLNKNIGLQYENEIQEILWNWPEYVEVYPDLYEIIEELKNMNHKIYILSNTSRIFYRILDKELFKIKSILDGYVISCEVGCMKPDYNIYEMLINKYQLNRSSSIFFDDIQENVKSALDVGLLAYHITNIGELKEKLRVLI